MRDMRGGKRIVLLQQFRDTQEELISMRSLLNEILTLQYFPYSGLEYPEVLVIAKCIQNT